MKRRMSTLLSGIIAASYCVLNAYIAFAEDATSARESDNGSEKYGTTILITVVLITAGITLITYICGSITAKMNQEKGYEQGFAWGALLWIIGIAIVACRPYKNQGKENNKNTPADELTKYKNLLDSGAITQEEYDAKKKQLLGI